MQNNHRDMCRKQLISIGSQIDPSGCINQRLINPFIEADIKADNETNETMKKFYANFDLIKPDSKESEILFRYAEGKLKSTEKQYVSQYLKDAYGFMMGSINERWVKVNEMRKLAGQPLRQRKDVMCQIQEIIAIERALGNLAEIPKEQFIEHDSPLSQFELKKLGIEEYSQDAVTVFHNYISIADKTIYLTGPATKIRSNLELIPPNARQIIGKTINEMLGQKHIDKVLNDKDSQEIYERCSFAFYTLVVMSSTFINGLMSNMDSIKSANLTDSDKSKLNEEVILLGLWLLAVPLKNRFNKDLNNDKYSKFNGFLVGIAIKNLGGREEKILSTLEGYEMTNKNEEQFIWYFRDKVYESTGKKIMNFGDKDSLFFAGYLSEGLYISIKKLADDILDLDISFIRKVGEKNEKTRN